MPKNVAEILLFIFLAVGGYIYEELFGVLLGGLIEILLIIRTKPRKQKNINTIVPGH
jgi:hypothetical protein